MRRILDWLYRWLVPDPAHDLNFDIDIEPLDHNDGWAGRATRAMLGHRK